MTTTTTFYTEAHPGWPGWRHERYPSLSGLQTVMQDVCLTCGWRLFNGAPVGDRLCDAATRAAHVCEHAWCQQCGLYLDGVMPQPGLLCPPCAGTCPSDVADELASMARRECWICGEPVRDAEDFGASRPMHVTCAFWKYGDPEP